MFTSSAASWKQYQLITTWVMWRAIRHGASLKGSVSALACKKKLHRQENSSRAQQPPRRREEKKKGGMKPDESHYPAYCPQMSVSQGKVGGKPKNMSGSTGSPDHEEALRAASFVSESRCHTETELKLCEQMNTQMLVVTLLNDELTLMRWLDAEFPKHSEVHIFYVSFVGWEVKLTLCDQGQLHCSCTMYFIFGERLGMWQWDTGGSLSWKKKIAQL